MARIGRGILMKRSRRIIQNTAVILLALALIITSVMPAAEVSVFAVSGTKTVSTKITDYTRSMNKSYRNKKVKIRATISPAKGGRTVMLQRYDSKKATWNTILTTVTADADSAGVSFTIPKKYRKRTTSYWRIYAPATAKAKAAASQTITLITRNIKKYDFSAEALCIYRVDGNNSGTYIYSSYMDEKRPMASTTKLMTAVLLMESGKLNTRTRISGHAAATPWGSGKLAKGDIYRTRDLLYAMLLPSSNDAATAVAEKVGGSESAFVSMMNNKARKMGLTHTHYMNPHGLDASGHYTTAAELARLTAYAYTFPEIRECWATKSKTIYSLNTNKSWNLWTTNSIINYVQNFIGGKTGTTDDAGCCFAGVYKYKGATYVTVVLDSGYGFSRWSDTQKLHSYIRKYAAKKY